MKDASHPQKKNYVPSRENHIHYRPNMQISIVHIETIKKSKKKWKKKLKLSHAINAALTPNRVFVEQRTENERRENLTAP
jgi:hypothetical protein